MLPFPALYLRPSDCTVTYYIMHAFTRKVLSGIEVPKSDSVASVCNQGFGGLEDGMFDRISSFLTKTL